MCVCVGGGGGGGVQNTKKIPQEIINQIYIYIYIYIYSYRFCQKIYAQGGSVQVRLLQINYEVNDKSKLEIKRDFFNLNMTNEKILLRTTLTDTVVGLILKLKSSTFFMYYSQIFTDQTTRNCLE